MSVSSRAELLHRLESDPFDLLVVGGGITGCGVARDAALRGLRVALVEKNDFASGTSSRSSRLIHGGVRYLEHGHLRLVFEASTERRRLLRLAPHLVRPLAFTWPVYRGDRVPRWKLAAGLALYDALALFRNVGRHQRLSRRGVTVQEPAVREHRLVGGARYWDAATDDTRLTLANALDARAAGAVTLNHVAMDAIARDRAGAVTGAMVTDELTGHAYAVQARVVVRAVGPWTSGTVRGSVGVHVSVPRGRVGNTGALTVTAPQDGRVMFILPAGSQTILGTTEAPMTAASPDEVRATQAEVEYLLTAANHFFPAARLARGDVIAAWAGVRPLVAPPDGASLGSASREHHVAVERGVVTATGGKLTTYRVMASDIVTAAAGALGITVSGDPTAERPLPGGQLRDVAAECTRARLETCLPAAFAERLVAAYGSEWRRVWETALAVPGGVEPLVPGLPYIVGEVVYAARHEMAATVGDVLIRRTHAAFELRDQGRSLAVRVAALLAEAHGWDEAREEAEIAEYEVERARMFGVEQDPVAGRIGA